MDNSTQTTAESVEDFGEDQKGLAKRWGAEIALFEANAQDWRNRCRKISKKYRDEREEINKTVRMFALFWSNIETLKPVTYSRVPKSDVQRRYKDADPVGRVACEIAERALDYSIDCNDRFDRVMRDCVEDYLILGQGTAWQRYVPHFKQERPRIAVTPNAIVGEQETPATEQGMDIEAEGVQVSNDSRESMAQFRSEDGKLYPSAEQDEQGYYVNGEPVDVIEYEEVVDDYVYWQDFGWNSGARTWDEVYAIWRIAYLSRDELKARFGEKKAKDIPLDYEPRDIDNKMAAETRDLFKKATIYEIWDRTTKRVIWLHKAVETTLDVKDDPLQISDFFPAPRPAWATQSNDILFPIADYVYYQDQDNEINDLTARISMMEKSIRVRGFYPGQADPFRTLLQDAGDLDMVPYDQQTVAALQGMGLSDLSKAIFFFPFEVVVSALRSCIEMRAQLIQDVYQITGLSDIVRGQSDPNETAEAQAIKAQSSGRRVSEKTKEIARFARDMLRIKFEIIFNHFDDSTIWAMTSAANIPEVMADQTKGQIDPATLQPGAGMPQVDEYGQVFRSAMKLLRNKALRHFRVDIETDSTVAADDVNEKQKRNEFVTAVGTMLGQAVPILKEAPELAQMMGESIMFVARGFKAGQGLENSIETGFQALAKRLANPQPDPAQAAQQQAEQAKMQATQIKAQTDMAKTQASLQETQINAQLEARNQEIETGRLALEGIVAETDRNPQVVVQ